MQQHKGTILNMEEVSKEYSSIIKNKLSVVEKLSDTITSADDRLDITNKLLILINNSLLVLNDLNAEIYDKLNKISLLYTPLNRYDIFNVPLPSAESGLMYGSLIPTLDDPSYLRIYICVSVAGVLRVVRTRYKTTITEDLNSGTVLTAGSAYTFTISWRKDDSINLRYSVSGGTIYRLLIDEAGV